MHQVILQTEHPILRRPFFMLHRAVQGRLYASLNGDLGPKTGFFPRKYLFTWFHVYGALLNLSVPAAYFSSVLKSLEIERTNEETLLEEVK